MASSSFRKPVVLIAEDELALREIFPLFLTDFEVWFAADGQEAVEIYCKHHRRIDLVVMDFHMPRLAGLPAFKIMRQLNPNLLCCFMTGGIERDAEDMLLKAGAAFILHKPFAVAKLAQTLRHILSSQPILCLC